MANQRGWTLASDAARVRGWPSSEEISPRSEDDARIARSVMRPVPFVVNASDPLLDILSLTLLAMRTPIPVVNDGVVVGALRAREIETLLLAHEDDDAWMIDLTARDVMVSP